MNMDEQTDTVSTSSRAIINTDNKNYAYQTSGKLLHTIIWLMTKLKLKQMVNMIYFCKQSTGNAKHTYHVTMLQKCIASADTAFITTLHNVYIQQHTRYSIQHKTHKYEKHTRTHATNSMAIPSDDERIFYRAAQIND